MNNDIRYNLRLPQSMYNELGKLAKAQGTSRLQLIQKFIRLGLLVSELNGEPDSELYLRRNEEMERIIII